MPRRLCALYARLWASGTQPKKWQWARSPLRRCSGRPDIVWFGEIPYHMPRIEQALAKADLFVAIGTSGAVYPAAGFVQMADAMGADTLELNLAPSDVASAFADSRYGPATEVVPMWVRDICAS